MEGIADSVGHMPSGGWKFDAAVVDCFDDMLQRSIPDYQGMRSLCESLGREYAAERSVIVDLGCSKGDALAGVIAAKGEGFADRVRMVGIECSAEMAAAARERFTASSLSVDVIETDLATYDPPRGISLALSILTLQFVPVEHRQSVVQRVFDAMRPGGAMILVEKVLGQTARIHQKYTSLYHGMKVANGYSVASVQAKAKSLEGVMVCKTARENEMMLRDAGFASVDCFWRHLNFAGWLAVKS